MSVPQSPQFRLLMSGKTYWKYSKNHCCHPVSYFSYCYSPFSVSRWRFNPWTAWWPCRNVIFCIDYSFSTYTSSLRTSVFSFHGPRKLSPLNVESGLRSLACSSLVVLAHSSFKYLLESMHYNVHPLKTPLYQSLVYWKITFSLNHVTHTHTSTTTRTPFSCTVHTV